MANICASGLVWELDGEGMIIASPVWITKAIFLPSKTGDQCRVTSWGPQTNTQTARTTMLRKDVTITSNSIITSTGNFEAAEVVVGDIINIYASEDTYNIGHWQVGTRSSDNAIVVDTALGAWGRAGGALTNNTAQWCDWKIWAPSTAFRVTDDGTPTKAPVVWDFGSENRGKGRRFPNLSLNTLSGGGILMLYVA